MARTSSQPDTPRRLPRGRHALAPEAVLRDQRARLLAAVPGVAAERGYEAMSVADIVKAAAVSRNAFYKSFRDKRGCVAAAQEAGHERLFGLISDACKGTTPAERLQGAMSAALGFLGREEELARFLLIEAPAAGEEPALRHHEWLRRYGSLLRTAGADGSEGGDPPSGLEPAIAGGIASAISGELLLRRGDRLEDLAGPLSEGILALYGRLGDRAQN